MSEIITDLVVIYGNGANPPPGYTKIEVDFNSGAGGEYVYLCYRKSFSGTAITSLNVFAGSSSEFPIQNGFTKVPGDLSKGAGGQYVYVCYNTDQRFSPIREITAIAGGDRFTYPSNQYVRIDQDCNEGAGGKYIYICYYQPR